MTRGIKGVLFDKDGTLLDFQATWGPTLWAAASRYARGDQELAQRLMRAGGLGEDGETIVAGSIMAAGTNDELAHAWEPYLPDRSVEEILDDLIPFLEEEGARNAAPIGDLTGLFEKLKSRGLKLGIATNDNESSARLMMQSLGLDDLLDFIAGYDSGHGGKPGPGMLHGFCESVDVEACEVAMVGDNRHDMDMGKAGGAGLLVAVLSGNGTRADLSPHADIVIDSVEFLEAELSRR